MMAVLTLLSAIFVRCARDRIGDIRMGSAVGLKESGEKRVDGSWMLFSQSFVFRT